MLNRNIIGNSKAVSVMLFLLGSIGLISIMVLDKKYWHIAVFHEGWPDSSLGHLIRSVIIGISVFAILWSLIGNNKPRFVLRENNDMPLVLLFILGTLSLSVIILCLFIFDHKTFSRLSLEDGPIEWGSALLLFGSWIIVAASFIKTRKVISFPKSIRFSLAFLSFVFFVMAMEEVSWFQRQLGIETPAAFSANIQGEMNLHNFASNYVENIYYFVGGFLFLVVLPFVRLLFPFVSNNNYLKIFVPRPFIGIIGSIACAYNFDMWNIIFTQIAFFSSVVILFAFAIFSSDKNERYIVLFTISLVVITQALFLTNGENFARLWEVTEYKELFIPMAFFIYSLDLFSYINRTWLPKKS